MAPLEAVRTNPDGQRQVLLVTAGQVHHRFVEAGLSDGQSIEILSGLTPGDTLIRNASLDLKDKTKIKSN
ncbi:hypothetical protein N752_19195 [Desulforamulus aquiferis]|nr:hypothetical protein [Desulforamulus aquiferis]RYD03535.1 hypothetical protein N752_19195 [Desulforamulus aquiferis]